MIRGSYARHRLVGIIVVFAAAAACSSGDPVTDEVPAEEPTVEEERGDAPCENPRWDESPAEVTSLEKADE